MKPLRVDQVAKRLDCSPRTIRRLLDQGKLNGYKIGGTWRVEYDERLKKSAKSDSDR